MKAPETILAHEPTCPLSSCGSGGRDRGRGSHVVVQKNSAQVQKRCSPAERAESERPAVPLPRSYSCKSWRWRGIPEGVGGGGRSPRAPWGSGGNTRDQSLYLGQLNLTKWTF